MTWWQVLLLSLVPSMAVLAVLVLSPLVSWIRRRGLARLCARTESFLSGPLFGLVTYVCGNIGAGKTTCGAGICNVLSRTKRARAMARAEEVRRELPGLDFNEVDAAISLAFRSRLTNTDAILSFLFDRFPKAREATEGRFLDDGLFPRTLVSELRDYVDAVVALERNRYVYFNRRRFYCWTTDTWAMDYEPSMIDMKDRFEDGDYRIQRYATIFEDEKVLSGKVSTNFAEVAREDGGGDSFLRLIRQLGKGTVHYVSTAQDFERVVKQERELATGVFQISHREEDDCSDLSAVLLDLALEALSRWESFLGSFLDDVAAQRLRTWRGRKERFERAGVPVPGEVLEGIRRWSTMPSRRESRSRRLLSGLETRRRKAFADGYVTYRGTYYTSAGDVGKRREECAGRVLDLSLTFPLRYCYGSTDTYAFSILNDYMSLRSVRRQDFYDPEDHAVPREGDDAFERYFRGVLRKRTAPSRRR